VERVISMAVTPPATKASAMGGTNSGAGARMTAMMPGLSRRAMMSVLVGMTGGDGGSHRRSTEGPDIRVSNKKQARKHRAAQ